MLCVGRRARSNASSAKAHPRWLHPFRHRRPEGELPSVKVDQATGRAVTAPAVAASAASARWTKWLALASASQPAVWVAASTAALGLNFALFFLDRALPEYVDESDNLIGGHLISSGYRLYVDYFSQHMPF